MQKLLTITILTQLLLPVSLFSAPGRTPEPAGNTARPNAVVSDTAKVKKDTPGNDTNPAMPQRQDSLADTTSPSDTAAGSLTPKFLPPDTAARPAGTGSAQVSDTVVLSPVKKALQKRLLALEKSRSDQFEHLVIDTTPFSPFSISTQRLFAADAPALSDFLNGNPLGITVPLGVSSLNDRFLVYGNTAPVTRFPISFAGQPFFTATKGSDDLFMNEIDSLSIGPGNVITYRQSPSELAVPEAVAYWETGVFRENIFDIRFSRPLSPHLMLNLTSNYRYFRGQQFNHRRNDVLSLYRNFSSDTSIFSISGYNPLTNEYLAGLQLAWYDKGQRLYHASIKYGDMSNQVATVNLGALSWKQLDQFRTRIEAGIDRSRLGPFVLDITGYYHDNLLNQFAPSQIAGQSIKSSGNDRNGTLLLTPALPVFNSDTIGVSLPVGNERKVLFDKKEWRVSQFRPEATFTHIQNSDALNGSFHGSAGAQLLATDDDTVRTAVVWRADCSVALFNQVLRAWAGQDAFPYDMPYDSFTAPLSPLDIYKSAGADLLLSFRKAALLVGYQYMHGINDATIRNAWPSGLPPYDQPASTFVIAPRLGRRHGFGLDTRAMISDTKPVLKAGGAFSYQTHFSNTREYLDAAVIFDYWTPRDPVFFADRSDWSREVVNLGFRMAFQIRTFRIFYKIDNLLNRQYAYVPGFYTSGVTFRYGIDWYLQR